MRRLPARSFDEFFATLFGSHPYSLQVLGTPESLPRVDHAALVGWYRRFYRPEHMTLAVSGQVSATEVLAEARRLFGELPRGGRVVEPARPTPANPGTCRVIEQAAPQAQILAGGIAPSMSHPDHAAVKVLSTILGGGMAGRRRAQGPSRPRVPGLGLLRSGPRSGHADPLSGNRARQRDEGRGGAAPRDRPDSNRPRRRRGAPPRERISARSSDDGPPDERAPGVVSRLL